VPSLNGASERTEGKWTASLQKKGVRIVTVIDESWYERIDGLRDRTGSGGVVTRLDAEAVLVALVKEVELGDAGYVIPKGGVEAEESIDAAALREIAEETGLCDLTLIGHLGVLARQSFRRNCWQTSHYGLYVTTQIEGEITDPANYGLAWWPLRSLPPMIWRDERQLIAENADLIDAAVRRNQGMASE